ncbi:transketolase [Nisaea denitrificans]|uniref:transketolase n=1 Tax=Nisaea denitrificans TaxID=390877 RepID=UPI000412C6FF|nr:transketolase [Nisaea denitrificans]
MNTTSSDASDGTGSAVSHDMLANAIRALSMDAVEKAKSGHPGMPMGMADVATVLFSEFLNFDPKAPNWPDRDRFILSAGHGSMLIYSLLHLTGYEDVTLDEIKNFRQLDSKTPGHPEYGHTSGVETTTGPLGQGLANAVGMALAERMNNARFGDDLVDHYTYVIAGDGCLMEGISHEAASMAGHLKLGKLVVLFDDNGISIDGSTDLSVSDDQLMRFEAYGWHVSQVDGHDAEAVSAAIEAARSDDRPSLVACRTKIGFGAPTKEGKSSSHGAPLGTDEIAGARENLGWSAAPFEIPADVLKAWRAIGADRAEAHIAWTQRYDTAEAGTRKAFDAALSGKLPAGAEAAIKELIAKHGEGKPKLATRVASQKTLEVLQPAIPALVGGSADLTGSNNTKVGGQDAVSAGSYGGHYIYYGVREHAMAAAMNGMALHGGLIPYGGTFLVFTDYCRPSIRLSALMGLRVIYVMTHDSIGLGEDGPTHQPVEHVAALRAIPNLNVFRPADAIETAECWLAALQDEHRPSVLALTRQGLPTVRSGDTSENLSAKGGYVLSDASGDRKVTILATGSEIEIALEAQKTLEADGVATAVISMPSMERFKAQDADYRKQVLGSGTLMVAVEAGIQQSWDGLIGLDGIFVGMNSFGASAPAGDLYKHFGITSDAVVSEVKKRLG